MCTYKTVLIGLAVWPLLILICIMTYLTGWAELCGLVWTTSLFCGFITCAYLETKLSTEWLKS